MPDCKPVASCADTAPAVAALAALRALDVLGSSCHTLAGGELVECGEHYRVLQAYHDGCEGIERTSTAVRDGCPLLWLHLLWLHLLWLHFLWLHFL